METAGLRHEGGGWARRAWAVTKGVGISCSPRRNSRMYGRVNCSLVASSARGGLVGLGR